MEKLKEELKSMQSNPRLYLANYFIDLKQQVDLDFALKLDEKIKYLEIINKIEEIEKDYYKRSKPFSTFDQEIDSLVVELADDLKYRIEEKLFQQKTILFIKDHGEEKKRFLLINYVSFQGQYLYCKTQKCTHTKTGTEPMTQLVVFNAWHILAFSTHKLTDIRFSSVQSRLRDCTKYSCHRLGKVMKKTFWKPFSLSLR